MQFTIFTLAVAIFWVSIFAKVISSLRRQMLFLKYFSIYPLLLVLLFCILRLLLPVEWPFTIIINSQKVLPFIQTFLRTSFLQIGFLQVSLALVISVLWGSGTVSIILKRVRDYYRFRRLLDFLPETENKRLYEILSMVNGHRLLANVKIIVHDSIESPAIFGFIKPVILLPNINFSDDELLAIFIHESTHYQFGHGIIKCVSEFICACFWWNPFFKKLSLEIAHALEMHSDKAVCKKINADQIKSYLFCITRVANNINCHKPFSSMTCSLVEEKNDEKLKHRFKMILGGYYQNRKKCGFIIIPVIIIMFMLSYSVVLQPYSMPDQNTIGPCDDISSEWYLVETEDGYDLYDSTNKFIAQVTYIDESLNDLKIYKKLEDVK